MSANSGAWAFNEVNRSSFYEKSPKSGWIFVPFDAFSPDNGTIGEQKAGYWLGKLPSGAAVRDLRVVAKIVRGSVQLGSPVRHLRALLHDEGGRN